MTEMEITDQDVMELLLPVRDGPEDIPDYILFFAGDDEKNQMNVLKTFATLSKTFEIFFTRHFDLKRFNTCE